MSKEAWGSGNAGKAAPVQKAEKKSQAFWEAAN